jgi:hypothetical protein
MTNTSPDRDPDHLAAGVASSIMSRIVFATGSARGVPSLLRDCIGAHPQVSILPRERVTFRDMDDPEEIRAYFERETLAIRDQKRLIVNKAPANAPHIGFAAQAFPESLFIFIIRDPRDVLVSHQRGTQKWMKGANSTVEGCMAKIQKYYEGWLEAQYKPNVMLVRYEDLHQNFFDTMAQILEFIGVVSNKTVLRDIHEATNFQAQTDRKNIENRAASKRRGVIGEWPLQLKDGEVRWYKESSFFRSFMGEHNYGWTPNTYANILKAMHEAGVHFLTEEELVTRRLDVTRPNVVVQHDIDYLTEQWCADSVTRTAAIEAELGVPAGYNFLPMDDRRYQRWSKAGVLELIDRVRATSPTSYIGLHVNACERFYPASVPDAGNEPEDLDAILAYARQQIAEYRDAGIMFRIATAHGYGRAKKLPNNRDTPFIQEVLSNEGITLFDTTIRSDLMEAACHVCAITDVGGLLHPRKLNHGYELTDPRAYEILPAGTFLRFLTHPGNYPVELPSTVAMRVFS